MTLPKRDPFPPMDWRPVRPTRAVELEPCDLVIIQWEVFRALLYIAGKLRPSPTYTFDTTEDLKSGLRVAWKLLDMASEKAGGEPTEMSDHWPVIN